MRYSRLQDLGLTEDQIKDNLLFAAEKPGETMKVGMAQDRCQGLVRRHPARPQRDRPLARCRLAVHLPARFLP